MNPTDAELKQLLDRRLSQTTTARERVAVLELATRTVYEHIKFRVPGGGEGLDGLDGPERQAAAKCVDAVMNYYDVAVELAPPT